MSWTPSLLLAAVMWLDGGLRKPSSRSIVIRRSLFGPWRFGEIVGAGRWHAVGRWPSLTLEVLASEPTQVTLSAGQMRSRLHLIRKHVNVIRVLGVMSSLALVIGAPLAVSRFGGAGVYGAAGCLLVLGAVIAFVSSSASRRLGQSRSSSDRFGASFLWPFAAPHAAERLLALAVTGGSPVDVLRILMSTESFAQWVRPYAYDALHREDSGSAILIDGFAFALDRRTAQELLSHAPLHASADTLVCPRCGANYRRDVRECTDCSGLTLATKEELASPETPPHNTP